MAKIKLALLLVLSTILFGCTASYSADVETKNLNTLSEIQVKKVGTFDGCNLYHVNDGYIYTLVVCATGIAISK